MEQGVQIDSFGLGENIIVSKSSPVFGGVYKLAAIEKDGQIIPKIKISENTEKITNPGFKKVYRLIEKETQKAIADIIAFHDEVLDENQDLTIYHQLDSWKHKTLYAGTYEIHPLQTLVFDEGKNVYPHYSLDEIRIYSQQQKQLLWDEIFRLEYPHMYYVDLTKRLLDYKLKMLAKGKKGH